MTALRLGSLFDGIGGFPLAAVHCGGVPVWASEIEPFPMRVTKLRFPDMIHVGDITKLDGAKLPPVDVICGGSPCQDLSVAGLRKGLAGERSGLFMDKRFSLEPYKFLLPNHWKIYDFMDSAEISEILKNFHGEKNN